MGAPSADATVVWHAVAAVAARVSELARFGGLAAPDWYYRHVGFDWWLGTFLDTPLEVHALQLGVLTGVLLGVVFVRDNTAVAAVGTALLVLFLFGTFEAPFVCTTATQSCAHVRLKPWYFLGGWTVSLLVLLGATSRFEDARSRNRS